MVVTYDISYVLIKNQLTKNLNVWRFFIRFFPRRRQHMKNISIDVLPCLIESRTPKFYYHYFLIPLFLLNKNKEKSGNLKTLKAFNFIINANNIKFRSKFVKNIKETWSISQKVIYQFKSIVIILYFLIMDQIRFEHLEYPEIFRNFS